MREESRKRAAWCRACTLFLLVRAKEWVKEGEGPEDAENTANQLTTTLLGNVFGVKRSECSFREIRE